MLRYFGFHDDPFGVTPDPRYFYRSHAHQEALASLQYAYSNNRGFTALIAPPGMGKTTLLFHFLRRIRESSRSVFIFNTQCEPKELIAYILRDLGMVPGRSGVEMHDQFNGALVAAARAGQRFVLVIDEAQNLSDLALETVRILTNFETTRAKLIQIVLAGQPQLSDKLVSPSLVQLRQRLSTICRLKPFSKAEAAEYIAYRLAVAGYNGPPLFTDNALNLILEGSLGIPRTINNLCFNALSLCWAMKCNRVDGNMAAEVIADLDLKTEPIRALAPSLKVIARESDHPKQPNKTAGKARKSIPAVAAILTISLVITLEVARIYKARYVPAAPTNVLPSSFQTPVASKMASATIVAGRDSKTLAIEVTVEPQQTLSDIAVQYFGSFDRDLLHEIKTLNPHLVNPDHIEAGQKIRLPKPPPRIGTEY
jgi:general secretion pathway protein A